jgi:hypothetical protein
MGYFLSLCDIKQQFTKLNCQKKLIMIQKTYFKTKDYCKVKFTIAPENAETVEILGLNSDWENSVIMRRKKDGSFSADVSLPKETRHEFKYRVDEAQWINDDQADGETTNIYGSSNSLLII